MSVVPPEARPSAANPELDNILSKLRPFQREAYEFATSTSGKHDQKSSNGHGTRVLIADEMGLGKTITSLAVMAHHIASWPLLILCPASLRHTWPAEIEKFIPSLPTSAVYVVSGFDDADFYSNPNKRKRIKIVVATYSLLQNRSAAARVLEDFHFRCVIADESHNLKERSSQRCKLAMPLLMRADHVCLLSGTPALARPVELWAQLHSLAPKVFGSYTAYTKKFCNARRGRFGWDVKGCSNSDELHGLLKGYMIRRLKSDVLHDLPPKQRMIVPVKVSPEHASKCRSLILDMEATRTSIDELVGQDAESANFEARRMFMEAFQASGLAKAQAVSEYLLDWLAGSGTQKILVFAHHKEVLDALEHTVSKKMKGVGHIRIDGSVPSAERAARVKKFQTNAKIRVALLSVTAAGVGLTLTAASSVLFSELYWTPGVLAQAEDRAHRIGQVNSVNVMYCVVKDRDISIDMKLWAMLGRKIGTLGRIIDGQKNASMNAHEQAGCSNTGGGASAEAELQAFFAESSSNSVTTSTPSAVVRGSIQSFFAGGAKKKASPPKESVGSSARKSASSSTNATPLPSKKKTPTNGIQAIFAAAGSGTAKAVRGKKRAETMVTVKWSCKACTFDNSRSVCVTHSDPLRCEICNTVKTEECGSNSATTYARTPEAPARATTSPGINIDLSISSSSEDEDDEDEVHQEYLSAKSASRSRKSTTSTPETAVSSEIIEIDCDSSDDDIDDSDKKAAHVPQHLPSSKSGEQPSSIVLIDDGSHNQDAACNEVQIRQEKRDELSFAVSKNSGRISIFAAASGESLQINFDVEQVLTEEASDILLDMQTKRLISGQKDIQLSKSCIEFDDNAVSALFDSIDPALLKKANLACDLQTFCKEVKNFVSSFLTLREVEKKAFSEMDAPSTNSSLMANVAKALMPASSQTNSTERYGGGAKERAIENSRNGVATEEDNKVIQGEACAWCAKALGRASRREGVESTYCSIECAEEGRLRRGGMYASSRVRAQVFALERGVCCLCGIDAHALFLRISSLQPAERLNALCNSNWKLPQSGRALEKLLQNPKEGDFWQADHKLAVAEGGGDAGLENLQTLCVPCHKVETEKLRSRLKLSGGPAAAHSDSVVGPTGQMDIRNAFFSSAAPQSVRKPKRRKRTAD